MTQGEDARYIRATLAKYKHGKRERAFEIIAEHFVPAGDKAGTPRPLVEIHYQTGEWDALYVWSLEGGMADLERSRSENDIKWFAALVEQEGGEEAAAKLLAEYASLIDDAKVDVGHYHADKENSDE